MSTRRRAVLGALTILVLLTTACESRLTPPPGEGVVRYRDAVFTQVTKTADLTYGSATDQQGQVVTLRLDLYEPTGDTIGARPVVVLVHGGSFRSGNRTSAEIVDQANTYAKQGFVTASISYRLAPNGCTSVTAECVRAIADAKHDAQAAVRYLRSRAGELRLDTTRFAMAGSSAGGITALEVGYGPEDVGTSGTPGQDSTIKAAVSLSGARILTRPNAGEAKALLFHGTGDTVVPYQWALDTVTDAEAAGTLVELTSWDGAGHVPYVQHREEILTQTTNFLWWTLNLTGAAR